VETAHTPRLVAQVSFSGGLPGKQRGSSSIVILLQQSRRPLARGLSIKQGSSQLSLHPHGGIGGRHGGGGGGGGGTQIGLDELQHPLEGAGVQGSDSVSKQSGCREWCLRIPKKSGKKDGFLLIYFPSPLGILCPVKGEVRELDFSRGIWYNQTKSLYAE